jgi:8-oxo-dGTP pyrophosphatase MutT (NUDIX family)
VVRFPNPAAGTVIHRADRGILLLWRHRFVTDTWGWELPAGGSDAGESLVGAAVRESIEEAGWRPIDPRHMLTYHPINGAVDQTFAVFFAPDAQEVGPPTDPSEAERIEWVPVDRVREELLAGRVTDGMSVTGLLWALQFELS